MRSCPHCGEDAMSVTDRMVRMRGRPRECMSCGKPIIIPKVSALQGVVLIPPCVWAVTSEFELVPVAITLVVTAVVTWAENKVPLIKR